MLAAAAVLPLLPGHPGLPCPLRTFTGVPCPLCGMTTSVEATVRLDIGDALAANPVGILAVLVAIVLLTGGLSGRFRAGAPWPRTVPVWLPGILAGLAAMWAFQLHRFGFV